MLRIEHRLDNRLTDGGKFVSPTHRLRSTPQKHYFSASGTHFCKRLSKPQGLVRLRGLGKLKNVISSDSETATFRLVASIVSYALGLNSLIESKTKTKLNSTV
jgi:hypothetical protein